MHIGNKLRNITPDTVRMLLPAVLAVIFMAAFIVAMAVASCQSSTDARVAVGQMSAGDSSINKANLDEERMATASNVSGLSTLGLTDDQRDMFLLSVGNKLASTSSSAADLRLTVKSALEQSSSGQSQFYFSEDSSGSYYLATFYSERCTVIPVSTTVSGVNDHTASSWSRGSGETASGTMASGTSNNTSGTYMVASADQCKKFLPESAASQLASSLQKWASAKGLSCNVYSCTIDPSTIVNDAAGTSFTIQCMPQDSISTYLVKCTLDASGSTFAFSQV